MEHQQSVIIDCNNGNVATLKAVKIMLLEKTI
jgi:hypothetical protein